VRYLKILILFGACAGPAFGASQQDRTDCKSGNDIEKVVAACTRILDDSNTSSRDRYAALEGRGLALLARGTMFDDRDALKRALDGFKDMTDLEPQNARGYKLRADALEKLGDTLGALIQIGTAIRFAPTTRHYFQRGWINDLLGDARGAVADYDQYLRMGPEDRVSGLLNRGSAFNALGSYDDAIKDFSTGLSLAPSEFGKVVALTGRGTAYLHKGQVDLARRDFTTLVALPLFKEPQSQPYACWARVLVDEMQSALAACNDAVRAEKDDRMSLMARGVLHLRMNSYDLAYADMRQWYRLAPNSAEARYGLGIALLRAGDKGGDAHVRVAKQANPHVSAAFRRYGIEEITEVARLVRPLSTPPQAPVRGRATFTYPDGRFVHLGGANWRVVLKQDAPKAMTETLRNEAFVELVDPAVGVKVRIYDRFFELAPKGTDEWTGMSAFDGAWEK
jgi:tetratricopeptide (TPR) repeat protein